MITTLIQNRTALRKINQLLTLLQIFVLALIIATIFDSYSLYMAWSTAQ